MTEPVALFPDALPLILWRRRTGTLVTFRCGQGRRCRREVATIHETPQGAVVVVRRHAPDRPVLMSDELATQRAELTGVGPGSIKKSGGGRALLRGDGSHPGYVVALEDDAWWSDIVEPNCARHGALPRLSRADLMAATRRARAAGGEVVVALS